MEITSCIALKGTISLGEGDAEKSKTGKHGKLGVKGKWWVLAQPPHSLQGNGRQSPRVEPREYNTLRGENPSMGGKARPRAHSRYIHVK